MLQAPHTLWSCSVTWSLRPAAAPPGRPRPARPWGQVPLQRPLCVQRGRQQLAFALFSASCSPDDASPRALLYTL